MTVRTITVEIPDGTEHSAAFLAGMASVIWDLAGGWTCTPWMLSAMQQLAGIVADEALRADTHELERMEHRP